eukprot:scaffold2063_cov401-Prasinococcus_capsulatus_cf.AAC.10
MPLRRRGPAAPSTARTRAFARATVAPRPRCRRWPAASSWSRWVARALRAVARTDVRQWQSVTSRACPCCAVLCCAALARRKSSSGTGRALGSPTSAGRATARSSTAAGWRRSSSRRSRTRTTRYTHTGPASRRRVSAADPAAGLPEALPGRVLAAAHAAAGLPARRTAPARLRAREGQRPGAARALPRGACGAALPAAPAGPAEGARAAAGAGGRQPPAEADRGSGARGALLPEQQPPAHAPLGPGSPQHHVPHGRGELDGAPSPPGSPPRARGEPRRSPGSPDVARRVGRRR